jgi:hypothetical protein
MRHWASRFFRDQDDLMVHVSQLHAQANGGSVGRAVRTQAASANS